MTELDEKLVTFEEATKLLGVKARTVKAFITSGTLLTTDDGMIRMSDLLDFQERRLDAHEAVTGAIEMASLRRKRLLEQRAPITEEALTELEEL